MEFKFSRFNHAIRNKHNELLVYNSYKSNLCKIKGSAADVIEPMINNKAIASGLSEMQLTVLHDNGLIVPAEEDETVKLKLRFEEIVNDGCLALTILVTEKCNYRCQYCNQPFKKGAMQEDVQESLVKFVRKNIHRFNRLDVSWFGGEPLLAADVIELLSKQFIEICHQYKIPYTANITTNGYLLSEEMMRKMLRCNITSFQITIDGLADTHNRQKPLMSGGNTYHTVLNSLRIIRDNIRTSMLRIIIRTNITKEIYTRFEEYLDFYSREFGEDERFSFFFRPAMDWGGEAIDSMRDQLVENDVIEQVYKTIIENEKIKKFDAHRGFFAKGGTICAASKLNFFTIEPDGKVHKCSQIFDDDFDTCIGYIDNKGKMFIDDYKSAQWLLERSTCNATDCFFGGNCLSEFCPKMRIIGNKDRSCPHEKGNIDLVMQLLDLDKNNYRVLSL